MCVELHEISPKKVLVDDSLDISNMPVVDSEAIKKVFGLDKPRPKFADFKMSEEDHALEEYEAEKRKLFDGLEEDE